MSLVLPSVHSTLPWRDGFIPTWNALLLGKVAKEERWDLPCLGFIFSVRESQVSSEGVS